MEDSFDDVVWFIRQNAGDKRQSTIHLEAFLVHLFAIILRERIAICFISPLLCWTNSLSPSWCHLGSISSNWCFTWQKCGSFPVAFGKVRAIIQMWVTEDNSQQFSFNSIVFNSIVPHTKDRTNTSYLPPIPSSTSFSSNTSPLPRALNCCTSLAKNTFKGPEPTSSKHHPHIRIIEDDVLDILFPFIVLTPTTIDE
jgi:hypothetical protein